MDLHEKENYLGGHAKTATFDGVDLDLGFKDFNSVSLDRRRGCEWGNRNGLSSLFAQKKNLFNPYFWQMLREIFKFKNDVISYLDEQENNPDIDRNETLEQFVKSRSYSELFQKAYHFNLVSPFREAPSDAASKALLDVIISKERKEFGSEEHTRVSFRACYGFLEDELKAGIASAHGILGVSYALLSNPKHILP
ncbi:hypothetical protein FEM48_Zijuj07G0095000 [Ziziphus jujuba var. spinosa]|uniref:Uncharacterized protein n=1 Tax=Ziziphus jujuba var. spinosa TaxID=714518 RepID=A0A978V3V0_ZIZJJ|nr:hypothetical protein FEM48_Zijuj07G0095000 [Ziziphus jujuba var. spinosa]